MSNNTKLNSLGLPKPPDQTHVAVALSGGVDSSLCAAILKEKGYNVIGITLELLPDSTTQDAKKIAENLGIPFHSLNCKKQFKEEIIEPFAKSYLHGQTPVPCAHCNRRIKFGALIEHAKSLGADCIATGHYIRRETDETTGHASLFRGTDTIKDQSYFLFNITQKQLDYVHFPLGTWSKEQTREKARALNLPTAEKPESQDICFIPDGNYAALVKDLYPTAEKPGDILHIDGRTVGTHKGIIHYTIGQRKGLGIGGGISENNSPLYVIALHPKENQVIVGPKESLARDVIYIKDCNWLWDITEPTDITVKFRSVMKPTLARLIINKENNTAKISFTNPQYGISPGQAAVCYINDRIIGGGWIIKSAYPDK